ncbi:hypothetical protein J4434_03130 [Candidatus Woesearchaeota archaeon]|nr:hypothetical protein [Candidatus Woesearchaeota archaeon]
MPFDPNLDKSLFAEAKEMEKSRITVSVLSYNNGTPKLQITRENKNAAGEYQFAKLGRMTKEEIAVILPIIQKAVQKM